MSELSGCPDERQVATAAVATEARSFSPTVGFQPRVELMMNVGEGAVGGWAGEDGRGDRYGGE